MITSYRHSRRPSGCFVALVAIILVLGCYLIWSGILEWLSSGGDPDVAATRRSAAGATDTATSATKPAFLLAPTRTEVPDCQVFYVHVTGGSIRECPDITCERLGMREYEEELCAYGRAEGADYPAASEWYVIDLNPTGAFRDLAYMHESVIKPRNPTPKPSRTPRPLPTITPTFTHTPLPAGASDTPPPLPSITPQPSPTATRIRPEF